MNLIISREDLLYSIQTVQRAVSPKSPLPILSGIKFETEGESLIVTATDLEVGVQCQTKASIIEPGAVVLPARYIFEFVRRLPDVPIYFYAEPSTGNATIKYEHSETTIHGFPVNEFPELPLPLSGITFNIDENNFKEAIKQVVFAAGTDENRPVLTGILMEIKDGKMCMVATDTHRLASRQLSLEDCGTFDISVIIPGKTLNELSRIIGKPENFVNITITQNQILFKTEDVSFISRLINGRFPPYQQVIPQEPVSRIRVNTRRLLEATERAALLTMEGTSVIKFSLQDDVLVLVASAAAGRIYEEIPVSHEGETIQVAFNARYLSESLKVVAYEEINLELAGPLNPGIIKPVGDEGYFSLLLPVRIKEDENT